LIDVHVEIAGAAGGIGTAAPCLFSGRNKIPGYLPGKEVVMENWLSIAVAVYLIGMVLYGHYKGSN